MKLITILHRLARVAEAAVEDSLRQLGSIGTVLLLPQKNRKQKNRPYASLLKLVKGSEISG